MVCNLSWLIGSLPVPNIPSSVLENPLVTEVFPAVPLFMSESFSTEDTKAPGKPVALEIDDDSLPVTNACAAPPKSPFIALVSTEEETPNLLASAAEPICVRASPTVCFSATTFPTIFATLYAGPIGLAEISMLAALLTKLPNFCNRASFCSGVRTSLY